jgi:PAS domain S-box-containing protein
MIPHLSERALILAPRGRDEAVAARLLTEAGLRCVPCPDLPTLMDRLAEGAGLAVLTAEALETADLAPLSAWIAAQPEWSDFPFILLTERGGGLERNPSASRHLDVLGNVSFLERPFHPTSLVSLARSALRGRRRQYEARARLEALRESEDHYRHTVEINPQVSWTATPDGRLDHVAQRWRDWTGTAGLGTTWGDALHPDDLSPTTEAWLRSVTTGAPYDVEHRIRMRDGSFRWVHSRAEPRRDAEGRIVKWYGTTEDITERKAAEEALRAESRLLETLNRAGTALAAELDLERLLQNLTDAGRDLTGARWGAFFQNAVDDATGLIHLYTLSGAPRSDFERLGGVRPTPIFGPTFRNEEVIRSDDVTHDPRYGRNPPYQGMPSGHVPVRSYLGVPVASRSGAVLGALLFGHPEPGRFQERHERLVLGLAAQAAVAIDNARLFQAVQAANETLESRVTERTAELLQAQEALQQAQKMEAIGQLTGGIAHDFNNLLTPIMGGLDILRRRVPDERSLRLIGGAIEAAERAKTLVTRLLAFARRQTLQPRPVSPAALIEGMRDLIDRSLGPSIEVRIEVPAHLPAVLVDPNQLELALLNLAVNARDAMPEGGRLTFAADGRDGREAAGLAPGRYVRLVVADTGAGMDEATLKRAVEPFFSTKGVGRGTGLGLSMVHGLAAQSGGLFRLASWPGQGTEAELWLPQAPDDARPEAPVEATAPRAPRPAVVLLVDDEALVRLSTAEALRELGYEVIEVGSGAEALEVIRVGLEPDVLVTDHLMPGLTGAQLAAELRGRIPGLAVLLITGYANLPPEQTRGLAVLTKPFRQADLATVLARMLDREPDARPAGTPERHVLEG